MALLSSKDDILARGSSRRYDTVKVPELGEDAEVRIRSLFGNEWEEYENSMYHQVRSRSGDIDIRVNNRHKRAKLIVRCVVDSDGALVFDPNKDVLKVSGMDAMALDRIFAACQKLSGRDEDAVEAAEENFGDTPSEDSITVSL